MSNLKNINLEVSKYAMKCVDDVIAKSERNKEYKTLVRKMPALIQKNGLVGTLAFVFSKKSNHEHAEVFKNIINWNLANDKINDLIKNYEVGNDKNNESVKKQNDVEDKQNKQNMENYIKRICKLEPTQYRQVTKEMMILFGWIKRFADALIEGES